MTRATPAARRAATALRLSIAGAALVSAQALAGSHLVELAWDAQGRFAHAGAVAPGKFVEVCGKLGAGDVVRWRFDASAPLDFNVHFHRGKETEYPARQAQVATGEDTLRVAVPEDYCWMWTNKSATPVTVDVRLAR